MSARYVQQSARLADDDLVETERNLVLGVKPITASKRDEILSNHMDRSVMESVMMQGSSPRTQMKAKTRQAIKQRKALKMVNLDELTKSQNNALKSTRF